MSPNAKANPRKALSKNYFRREIFLLKMFGISLIGNESAIYKMYSILAIGITNFAYPLVGWREIFQNDFQTVSQMMIYQCSSSVSVVKTLVMYRNRKKIGALLSKLQEGAFVPNLERGGDMELKLMQKCLLIISIQNMVYWIGGAACNIGVDLYCLIRHLTHDNYDEWEFPYGQINVLNVTNSLNFKISMLYQVTSIFYISVHFVTLDLLTAGVLAQISFHLKILQNNLRRLITNSCNAMKRDNVGKNDNDVSTIPWPYLKASLKEAMDYHLTIIDVVKEMEEIFSIPLMLIFLGTLGMFAFIVYNITVSQLTAKMMIRSAGEFGAVCMQVFTVCYWGEQVKTESENVRNAAYESNFVGADPRLQHALMLIMGRSQKTLKLTAGKFADVCLPTFTWILRTSYSAFMVLRKNETQ